MTPPPDPVRIELPETATLPIVRAMTLDLLHAFETGARRVVLDAHSVRRVDTAAMQSLASACRSARALEIEIVLEAPSEAFAVAARRLGLAHADALPLVQTQGA
ncbi:MAG: STAS domain-containing protein [Pseudomonadales bacterium]|jgi:anti-anti-sigma regulatory factor|nr:STAS domain-containing protein [Pseudomonadales bacterium]